jgi:hypothetical protein
VLLVTHSLDLVTRFCDEALWLDGGVIREQGDPKRVVDAYLMDVARAQNEAMGRDAIVPTTEMRSEPENLSPAAAEADNVRLEPGLPTGPQQPDDMLKAIDGRPSTNAGRREEPADMFRAIEGRWGTREAEIVSVDLFGPDGAAGHVFQSGDPLSVRMRVRAHQPLTDFVFGFGIFNADGVCCYGTNTGIEGAEAQALTGDAEVLIRLDRLDLVEGSYKLDVAVHRQNGAPYDYHRLLYTFRVTSRLKDTGIYRPQHRWTFTGDVRLTGL